MRNALIVAFLAFCIIGFTNDANAGKGSTHHNNICEASSETVITIVLPPTEDEPDGYVGSGEGNSTYETPLNPLAQWKACNNLGFVPAVNGNKGIAAMEMCCHNDFLICCWEKQLNAKPAKKGNTDRSGQCFKL